MLSDREQQTWREIQRGLVQDPSFARSANVVETDGVDQRAPRSHVRLPRPNTALVATTLAVLLFIDPKQLTTAELVNRRRPPAPRRSPSCTGSEVRLDGPADTDVIRALDVEIPRPRGFTPSARA